MKLYFDWWGGGLLSVWRYIPGGVWTFLGYVLIVHGVDSSGKRMVTLKIQDAGMHGLAQHSKPSPLFSDFQVWFGSQDQPEPPLLPHGELIIPNMPNAFQTLPILLPDT